MPMQLTHNIRDGVSVVPMLARLGRLGEAPEADVLVDFALEHKVIRPLQHRSEFLELARIVSALDARAMLEIGTFRGGTLFVFARLAAPDAVIVSLDLPISAMGRLYRAAQVPLFHQFTRQQQSLHLLRKNSHDPATQREVSRILHERRLDFLFIDGDHAYESVKADFQGYAPFVRSGGVVALHDIAMGQPSGVSRFWSELRKRHRHAEFVHDKGPKAMGIGVVWM
jgi:predicted O-methyltransferase YrrM